jgi:hypothetical protein
VLTSYNGSSRIMDDKDRKLCLLVIIVALMLIGHYMPATDTGPEPAFTVRGQPY